MSGSAVYIKDEPTKLMDLQGRFDEEMTNFPILILKIAGCSCQKVD
jgi:hypothetical protein